MIVLKIRGVTKTYTNHQRHQAARPILRDIDVAVGAGECVALCGPSGSGKSSLLRCVYGAARADSGSITMPVGTQSIDIVTATDREVLQARAHTMAMVTQFLSVTPRVSSLELITRAGIDEAQAKDLLHELGLAEPLHHLPPATFSGGERQMVNLAIAMAQRPDLLLLDEATASLDATRRAIALRLIEKHKNNGTAILAVFHDLPDTPGLIDTVVRLQDGQITEGTK